MAISSESSGILSVVLTSSGQAIPVAFPFYETSDLKVYNFAASDGAKTTLSLGVDYSVTGGNGSSGTVTLTAGIIGDTVIIVREIPLTQSVDLPPGGAFPADSVERALDRLTLISQQLDAGKNRNFRVSNTSDEVAELDTSAETTPNTLLGFSADGTFSNLTASQVLGILAIGNVVDLPLKVFNDDASRALTVPDYLGQIGIQLDRVASSPASAIFLANDTDAGDWAAYQPTVADGSISTAKLADTAVTTAKLADGSVTASKVASDAIDFSAENVILTGQVFS